jgi:uncharacterized membrane protein HdeD (DUF308 family)
MLYMGNSGSKTFVLHSFCCTDLTAHYYPGRSILTVVMLLQLLPVASSVFRGVCWFRLHKMPGAMQG